MMSLDKAFSRATIVANLREAYYNTSVAFVSGHTVDEEKYPRGRYAHVYAEADAQKAVYDAAEVAEKAAKALEEADAALLAALRARREFS